MWKIETEAELSENKLQIVNDFVSENEKRLNRNPLFILYADMAAIIDLFRFIQYIIQIHPPQDVSFAKKIITIYCFFVEASFRVLLFFFFFTTAHSHSTRVDFQPFVVDLKLYHPNRLFIRVVIIGVAVGGGGGGAVLFVACCYPLLFCVLLLKCLGIYLFKLVFDALSPLNAYL